MNPTQSNGREKGIDILSRHLERRDIAEIRASIRKPLMYSGSSFLLTFPSFDSRRKEQQGLQDRTTPFHVLSARIPFRKVYITKGKYSTTKNSQLTFISTLSQRKVPHIARIVFKREDAAFRNPVFSKSRDFGNLQPTVEGGEGKTSFICRLFH